ncbi:hybrid sensor histidine kinase/response regulator transcription factor [Ekhidna sp.]
MLKYFFGAVILFGSYIVGFSQQPLYTNYEYFDTEKGLPQSYVTAIVQDDHGFIWISTLDGLARYDGKNFLKFNVSTEGGRNISTSQVYDLRLDSNNILWVLHHNFIVDQINTKTLDVKLKIDPIASIAKEDFLINIDVPTLDKFGIDQQGNWFVGDTSRYFLYDSSNVKMNKLFNGGKKPYSKKVYSYIEDRNHRLWLMVKDGLLVSDEEWSNFEKINIPEALDFNPIYGRIKPMRHLSNDRILFAIEHNLYIYYEKEGTFRLLELPAADDSIISGLRIFDDHQGGVIIKYSGLILRLEEDESITLLWKNPARASFTINTVHVDQSNTMWVGLNAGGMYRVDLNKPTFQSSRYDKNFLSDILTDQMGLERNNLPSNWNKDGEWSYGLRYHYSSLGFFITHESIGFGDYRRIYKFLDDKFERIPLEDIHLQYIVGIAESNDELWALDLYGNIFNWKDLDQDPDYIKFKTIRNGPTTERLSDMVADDEYQWVIATKNVLYQLKQGNQVAQYSIGKDGASLIDISEDVTDPNILWVASLGGGLIKWDKESKQTLANYTMSDGMSSNSIGAIVPDSLGNIWLGTFNGISRFNIEKEQFTNYFTKDGIVESEFNRHHSLIFPDGRIAFGGMLGYSVFNPKDFVDDEYQPVVNVTDLQINNESIDYSSDQFAGGIIDLEHIDLAYDQNSLRFEIAAMQYNDPLDIEYRYKLENYNKQWVELQNERIVRLDNLPSGNYTLNINATNTDGVWSNKVTSIRINIDPPPWLSWWAYTLYSFIFVVTVFLIWRNYKRKLIREQEEEFNRREAQRLLEMDEMKTRFFSNITHEFRTPLTLILSPLEKHIRDNNFPPKAIELFKSNYRHGSHLLKLVNQLLDIAKLESGSMQMHNATGELGLFVKNCVDQFEVLSSEKKISLQFINDNVEGHYLFDKGHWEKIIYNLVSNAVKFTPESGKVTVKLNEELESDGIVAVVKVADTGIGIDEELLPKLFDRFYQVDDSVTREQEGTGIGLSLVKELTTLMKGEIFVESELGIGTTFTVKIPISKFEETAPISKVPQEEVEDSIQENFDEESPLLLIVEDNEELRSFIVESLSERWNVLQASNGNEAWKLIEKELPEIVISDVMMPGMNGIELCNLAKNDNRTAHISFIMLTAKTAQESKEQGLEAGADMYLTKPFHVYELELRIQNLIQQQQNLREHLQSELLPQLPMAVMPTVDDEFLNNLYEYLNLNLKESSLGIDKLASEMAMSKSTLNRKLKALLNISTNEFVKQYRLQRAVEFMIIGQNISEVAYNVGFESPSYFSQCFKSQYGLSPSEYQRSLV